MKKHLYKLVTLFTIAITIVSCGGGGGSVGGTANPGTIAFSTSQSNIAQGSSGTILLNLSGISVSTAQFSVIASIISTNQIVTLSSNQCQFSNSQTSCNIKVIVGSGATVGQSFTISATAPGYTIAPLTVTIVKAYFPSTQVGVYNNCGFPVYMQAIHAPSQFESLVNVAPQSSYDYSINGQPVISFTLFPKYNCDATGQNCEVGQEIGAGPILNGKQYSNQPPIDSLFEGTFNVNGSYYDGSAVNGYTLPFLINVTPSSDETSANCLGADASALTLDKCPTNDDISTPANEMSVYGSYAFGPFPTAYEKYDNNGIGISGPHDMTKVNLQIISPATGKQIGCAAPSTIVNNYPGWGTLGIAQATGTNASNFTTPVIMYTCPYVSNQLLFVGNPTKESYAIPAQPSIQPGLQTGYNNMANYCNSPSGICSTDKTPNDIQASHVCNLGPINHTKYVTYLNTSTTAVYTQTYNDVRGGLECNSSNSHISFVLCPAK